MRLIQTLCLVFMTLSCFAQKPETFVRLAVFDLSERPMEVEVTFRCMNEVEVEKTITDKNGQGSLMLKKGLTYMASAVGSADDFVVELPELSEDTIDLELVFETYPELVNGDPVSIEAVDTNLVGIYVFNKPEGVILTSRATTETTKSKLYNKENKLKIPVGEPFVLEATSVFIKNSELLQTSFSADMVQYALYFESPDTANLVQIKNQGVLFFTFYDLYDKRTGGEIITLYTESNKNTYAEKTNPYGVAIFFVPLNDAYYATLINFDSFKTFDVGNEKNVMQVFDWKIQAPSTAQVIERKLKLERLAFKHDSIYRELEKNFLHYQDSLRAILTAYQASLVKPDTISTRPATKDTLADRAKMTPVLTGLPIPLNVPIDPQKIETGFKADTSYFVKNQLEILSAFYRNRDRWRDKIIITDVTSSMDPYAQQLLIWHKLFPHNKRFELYSMFFNDGDHTPNPYKVLGRTDGIYMTDNPDFDSIQACMSYTIYKGGGGDIVENNIEVLLKAQIVRKREFLETVEIIMIADNFAGVRDIKLIEKLKVPIRIVLCGANTNAIHPHYLLIAWKTNGSIHTIEEDITDMAKIKNGDILTIAGRRYRLLNGEFYEY
jgi:hypothetical protein